MAQSEIEIRMREFARAVVGRAQTGLRQVAPGETRCNIPHGVESLGTDGPEIRATTAAVLGCPACGAQL